MKRTIFDLVKKDTAKKISLGIIISYFLIGIAIIIFIDDPTKKIKALVTFGKSIAYPIGLVQIGKIGKSWIKAKKGRKNETKKYMEKN